MSEPLTDEQREAIADGAQALIAQSYRVERGEGEPGDNETAIETAEHAAILHEMVGNDEGAEACRERARRLSDRHEDEGGEDEKN